MVFGDRAFDSWFGTLQFWAPEFVRQDAVDARADLYAVGVLLFMLLTGRHPASRSTSLGITESSLSQGLRGDAEILPELKELSPQLPTAVAQVVTGLLAPNPDHRLRTAALAFDALCAWFMAEQRHHGMQLSHVHKVSGQAYLAAAMFCGRHSELLQAE